MMLQFEVIPDTDRDGTPDVSDADDDNDSLGIGAIQSGGGCDTAGVPQPRFRDCIEVFIGTDPFRPCASTATANDEAVDAVPADLNDDRVINATDRTLMMLAIKNYNAGSYNPRYDLNASNSLNVTDRTIIVLYLKATASAPCA